MAIRPDYTIGTLSLTSGSANFTTSGSALQTASVQAGDEIITRSGDVLIIATITGQNSGTLFQNCPASAAGTGQPLRIRFQPDGSRYQGAVRDLVERLANGILENIAAIPVQDGKTLVGNTAGQYEPRDYIADTNGSLGKFAALTLAANKILNTDASGNLTQSDITAAALVLLKLAGTVTANKLPFFDSASSAALTDLTTFARSILDDTTGAAMFNTMGATSGTNWRKLPNGLLFQWGSTQVTTDASGNAVLTFPTAFTANDSFQVTAWNDNKDAWGATLLSQYRSSSPWPKSTGFVVGCWNTLTGGALANQPIRVGWQAFGS